MKKHYVLLVIGLLAMVSCNSSPEPVNNEGKVYMRSFVPKYYSAKGIEAKFTPTTGMIGFFIHIYAVDISGEYAYNSVGEDKTRYDEICVRNCDLDFNRYVKEGYSSALWGEAGFFDTNFTNVSITADEDYDEAHPAGTELNDIWDAGFYTAYPYIEKGYPSYSKNYVELMSLQNIPSELSKFKIMGDGKTYQLMWFFTPRNIFKYFNEGVVFTIKLTVADGRVFEDTVTGSMQ